MDDNSFKKVFYKKKKKKLFVSLNSQISDQQIDYSKFFYNIKIYREELKESLFYKKLQGLMTKLLMCWGGGDGGVDEIVCYGLGDLSNCKISQLQFAALLNIAYFLQVCNQKVYFYDPIFKISDHFILEHYNLQIIPFNEEGKHECATKTLIYALHCGRPLYNNILTTNWQHQCLHNIAIFANSFHNIIHNTSQKSKLEVIPAILQLVDMMVELEVENEFKFGDVFNDTSLHFFPNNLQHVYQNPPPSHNYHLNDDIIFNIQSQVPSR